MNFSYKALEWLLKRDVGPVHGQQPFHSHIFTKVLKTVFF